MERYWNDPELMSKIASKMGAMDLTPGKAKPAKKAAPVRPSFFSAGSLHSVCRIVTFNLQKLSNMNC